MANWEKLNREFDDLINNLPEDEWDKWYENREVKKAIRRQKMNLKIQIQELKLRIKELETSPTYTEIVEAHHCAEVPTDAISFSPEVVPASPLSNRQLAMAA